MTERADGERHSADLSRTLGLDRSGPAPVETRAGEPLRPLTIPNGIGLLRLIGLGAFLLLAFRAESGPSDLTIAIYVAVALADYLDGLVARVTGQYSRLGAMLDPAIDRLTVLSGAVVCWHFDLLPKWLLLVLAARELSMLLIAQWGIRKGFEIKVNWPGRIAVFPIMAAFPLAMLVDTPVADVLLVVGSALAILATILYIRAGLSYQPSTRG